MTSTAQRVGTSTAARTAGLLLLATALAGAPASLEAQETRTRVSVAAERDLNDPSVDLPPFCRTDSAYDRAGEGHPEFGWEWCERELARLRGDVGALASEVDPAFDIVLEPFCKDGSGHPEFGTAWCRHKQEARQRMHGMNASIALARHGAIPVEFFCIAGPGHPRFGRAWCGLGEEARAKLRERLKEEGRN